MHSVACIDLHRCHLLEETEYQTPTPINPVLAGAEMVRVYELAKKKFPDYDEWGVWYSASPVLHPFVVWQGPGYHAHGTECSVQELLSDRWRNHLRLCGALWLVPLLERFATGEAITTKAVLEAYEQKHSHPPPSRDV